MHTNCWYNEGESLQQKFLPFLETKNGVVARQDREKRRKSTNLFPPKCMYGFCRIASIILNGGTICSFHTCLITSKPSLYTNHIPCSIVQSLRRCFFRLSSTLLLRVLQSKRNLAYFFKKYWEGLPMVITDFRCFGLLAVAMTVAELTAGFVAAPLVVKVVTFVFRDFVNMDGRERQREALSIKLLSCSHSTMEK